MQILQPQERDAMKEALYKNLATYGINAERIRELNLPEEELIDFTCRIAVLYAESKLSSLV